MPSSQCQWGTVASATVSLDKSTGLHVPWVIDYLLWGIDNLSIILDAMIYWSFKNNPFSAAKNVQFTWAMCDSKKNHPDSRQQQPTLGCWVSDGHAGEPSPQAAQSLLSQQQLSVG